MFTMPDKNTRSPVGSFGVFRAAGKVYEHSIFCSDDDRVECIDREGNVILTFTANSDVYVGSKKGDKKQLGRCKMKYRTNDWEFVTEGGRVIDMGRDLLRGEVMISKMYIELGTLELPPEGGNVIVPKQEGA